MNPSIKMSTTLIVLLILVPQTNALGNAKRILTSSNCHATCSSHVTLPCTFPALNPCIQRTCDELCAKDGKRAMIGCFCRSSAEGQTMRTCFCGPSKLESKKKVIVF